MIKKILGFGGTLGAFMLPLVASAQITADPDVVDAGETLAETLKVNFVDTVVGVLPFLAAAIGLGIVINWGIRRFRGAGR